MIVLSYMASHLSLSVGNKNLFAKVGVLEYLYEMNCLNSLRRRILSLIILCG